MTSTRRFWRRFANALKDRVEAVNVSQRLVDSPACVVNSSRIWRRNSDGCSKRPDRRLPESKPILEINVKHPLVIAIVRVKTDDTSSRELSQIVLDHALLAEGAQLDNPADYVRRMNQYLLDLENP